MTNKGIIWIMILLALFMVMLVPSVQRATSPGITNVLHESNNNANIPTDTTRP